MENEEINNAVDLKKLNALAERKVKLAAERIEDEQSRIQYEDISFEMEDYDRRHLYMTVPFDLIIMENFPPF